MKMVSVDKYQRVRLPGVKGGQKFAFENNGHGILTLTEVKPVETSHRPNKVRFVKKHGRTVGVTDRPIDMQALDEALKEFP